MRSLSLTHTRAAVRRFAHSTSNSDTESLGIMKNFGLPKTKRVTGYSWVQIGLTSYTGSGLVQESLIRWRVGRRYRAFHRP